MADSAFRINRGLTLNPQSAAPSNPTNGDIYYDSSINSFVHYNNGFWQALSARVDVPTAASLTSADFTAAVMQRSIVKLTGSTASNIHGMTASADAKQAIIYNSSTTAAIVIKYQSATETTAANRIVTSKLGDVTLKPGQAGIFEYDSTQARWVLLSVSGTGTGDANSLLERLTNRLIESSWTLVTPNIGTVNESALIDLTNSTALYSTSDETYNFTGVQNLYTIQLADPSEFMNNTDALSQIELEAFWNLSFVDTAATYKVSRNGFTGGEFQTVSMTRVGNTDTYRGTLTFADQYTSGSLITGVSYTISNFVAGDVFTNVGAASNATGVSFTASGTTPTTWTNGSTLIVNQSLSSFATVSSNFDLTATAEQRLSQPVITSTKILAKTLTLNIFKTGAAIGNFYIQLVKDNSGNPSTALTDILCESSAVSISGLSAGANTVFVDIPDQYLAAGTYHIVLRTDSTYTSDYTTSAGARKISWQGQTAAATPYARHFDGTTWTVFSTNALAYNLYGIAIDLRVQVTSSTTSKLAGIGLFYNAQTSGLSTSNVKQRQVFSFSGSANTTSFTITNFVPDPDLLKVYDVGTGQVYTYGAFSINGMNVNFTSGQFLSPGNTITLVFDQTVGGSFDNSDRNANLLATNHLGSSDATVDRSLAGQGLFLRSPNGTLYEITVADDGSIATYTV